MDTAKKKVLIVEDEKDVVTLLRYLLKDLNYDITHCYSAEEAMFIWKSIRPDLVLLDVMLPNMSGLELCRKIRQTSQVPVLFISANASKADQSAAEKAGGDGYVMKPFSISALVAHIQSLLERPRESRHKSFTLKA